MYARRRWSSGEKDKEYARERRERESTASERGSGKTGSEGKRDEEVPFPCCSMRLLYHPFLGFVFVLEGI